MQMSPTAVPVRTVWRLSDVARK